MSDYDLFRNAMLVDRIRTFVGEFWREDWTLDSSYVRYVGPKGYNRYSIEGGLTVPNSRYPNPAAEQIECSPMQ